VRVQTRRACCFFLSNFLSYIIFCIYGLLQCSISPLPFSILLSVLMFSGRVYRPFSSTSYLHLIDNSRRVFVSAHHRHITPSVHIRACKMNSNTQPTLCPVYNQASNSTHPSAVGRSFVRSFVCLTR